jgi:hypothetical protein
MKCNNTGKQESEVRKTEKNREKQKRKNKQTRSEEKGRKTKGLNGVMKK